MSRRVKLGSWTLVHPLGTGGTGTVYRARHTSGGDAAVKVVRLAADRRPVRHALEAEVRAIVSLDHPNILQVYDVGEVDALAAHEAGGTLAEGTPWFAMELAEGGSLRDAIGGLDWPAIRAILESLLGALAHAHARKVLHLDLKPTNVLFAGRRAEPKLADFGMGTVGGLETGEDMARGTPQYMAPEQIRGEAAAIGPWTDLFALGCLTWRCVVGVTPAGTRDVRRIIKAQLARRFGPFHPTMAVPPKLEGWIRQLLTRDPAQRFAVAADALHALDVLCDRPRRQQDWRVSDSHTSEPAPMTGLALAAIRDPPFIGRTLERKALWRALTEARAGAVRAVLVRGAPGVGKQRLAEWLAVRVHELGLGLPIAVSPGGSGEAAIISALRHAAAPVVQPILGEAPMRGPALGVAVAEALETLAKRRLPVIWIEEAHQSGTSLECAAWVLTNGRSPPALWLFTANDQALLDHPYEEELLSLIRRLPGAEELALGPLSEQAQNELARRIAPLAPEAAAALAARAAGSPEYSVALVNEWVRRGMLEPGKDGFSLSAEAQGCAPAEIDNTWAAALSVAVRGRADWQAAIEVAGALAHWGFRREKPGHGSAGIGPTVRADEWQAACAELGLEVSAGLVLSMLEQRLMHRIDGGYTFVHPMLCERLMAAITEDGRAEKVHLACATVVDAQDPVRRARHWLGAGRPAEAVPLLLDWLQTPFVGEVGRSGQQLAALEQAAAQVLAGDDPRWGTIASLRVRIALVQGKLDEARAAARIQRGAAGGDLEKLLAVEANDAAISLAYGDSTDALAHAVAAGQVAERLATGEAWITAWTVTSRALRGLGRVADARDQVEWAALVAADEPSPARMSLWHETAVVALVQGRTTGALAVLDRLEAEARAQEARGAAAFAMLDTGDAWLCAGNPLRALDPYRAARRRFRALGYADEVLPLLGLATALVLTDREAEAEAMVERASQGVVTPRHQYRLSLVELVVRAGRPADPQFGPVWREVQRHIQVLSALEPLYPAMLRFAAARTPREERARELLEASRR